MEYGFLSRAGKFLQERAKSRRGTLVFLCLAAGVTLGTLGFLKLYGEAMTHKVKMLDCQYEVHVHTEDCYEENEDGEEVLICGLADYVIHVHNDDCYNQKGELVCQLEEHELHEHDDSCWEEEEILICEEEESEGSAADGEEAGTVEDAEQTAEPAEDSQASEAEEEESGSNAETVKELACEKEEHKHDDSCYADGAGCEKEAHTHGDSCYEKTEELVCDASEHTHDDSCYTTGESELTCEESEHTHDDSCYDEEGNEVCGESEHTHDDGCYSEGESELTCGAEEHTHGDGCYEVTETLVCEAEEHEHGDSCAAESELVCGIEEHEHDDSCYVEVEVEAGTEEKEESESAEEAKPEETVKEEDTQEKNNEEAEEGHTHTDDCYETREVLICGELELHTHDADPESETCCYTEDCFDEEGSLIEGSRPSCGLLQLEEHIHTEECFKTVELTPEEIAAINGGATLHVHTDECYDEEGNLICGHEVTHLHQLECYDEDGNLICGFGGGSHVHEESCYDEEGNLICGYETATHPHTADCYDEAGNLICGYETASHVHEESCYDEEGNLICGYETASHVHEENCYDEEGNLICGYETAVHPHTPDCYDEAGNLICGYETAVHVHTAECYDEEGNLICGYEAEAHEHDVRCYDEGGNLICGYEDAKDHEHDSNCYDEGGNLICGYEGVKNHEHDANCYDIKGNLVCGYEGVEDHVHTEACYDEKGNLICGYEVLEVYDSRKIYENDKYIVVVKYNNDANIPEEAELIAEEITPDSDQEHYGNRETEYREMLKDETASMRALLKIGFYLEGEEIEPETPVAVSIQFIDEDGLAEGKPITVIHFAEGGTEKLDGSDAKDNSTSFKMMSFSEIAIGYGSEEEDNMEPVKVRVSKTYEYEDPMFQATFHVEGDVVMPDGLPGAEDGGIQEENMFSQESQDELSDHSEVGGDDEIRSDEEVAPEDNIISEQEEETDSIEGTEEADDKTEENMPNDTSVITEEQLPGMIEFIVEPLREDADEYKAAEVVYGDGSEEVFLNRVLSYYLAYEGVKLDLTDCSVTMEVTPTQALVDYAEETTTEETVEGEKVRDEVTLSIIDFVSDADTQEDAAGNTEEQAKTTDSEPMDDADSDAVGEPDAVESEPADDTGADAADADGPEATETTLTAEILDAIPVTSSAMSQPMKIVLHAEGTENSVGANATSQANPSFTVEFYAELDVLAPQPPDDKETIRVIDTSKKNSEGGLLSDGTGGNLPTNAGAANKSIPRRNIKVDKDDGTVVTQKELTEIYSSGLYEYITSPGLVYFNKIAKNKNYILKEICVQRANSEKWETYSCENGREWHFTNKPKTQTDDPKNFILITEGAKIRLVHTVQEETVRNGVNFYDYDISDGNLYLSSSDPQSDPKTSGLTKVDRTKDKSTTHNSGSQVWYMYTNKQGINSMPGQTFGFGNSEGTMRTSLGNLSGNKATEDHILYGKATFGLVTGMKDGKLEYASGVKAPNLFNEGAAPGKTPYAGDLVFSQKGDTYTLTGAEVKEQGEITSSVYGLDKFNRQLYSWAPSSSPNFQQYYFAGNDFYPLDNVSSAGTPGHDLKFGAQNVKLLKNFGGYFIDGRGWAENAPASDDGQNHNHYFGMHYTVEFDLVKDYVGPLEYLFYGDDDMWVFLDGGGYSGKLICDIGGVHSSVGEYINLWDYIEKGSEGHYKLTFYYTERGASGSTCWMQFTLPSVSFATTEQDTGELRIEKKVTGTVTNEEFGFEIKFKDSAGNDLMNDYSYTKFDSANGVVENDILIWNNSKFTLKAGEYIVVKFLPDGSKYTITEVGPVTVKPTGPGEGTEWLEDPTKPGYNNPYVPETSGGTSAGLGTVTGDISKDNKVQIEYNNVLKFALPETGGPGTEVYTVAGALLILLGAGFVYKKKFRERRV